MEDKGSKKRSVWGYIFFDKKTPYKPEVLKIAHECNLSRREVFAILLEFWVWVDDNCPSGTIPGADVRFLSEICPGTVQEFWTAVARVGWLRVHDGSIEIPNFDRWLGNTAKRRAVDAMRKWNDRHGLTDERTNGGQNADKTRTRRGRKAPQSKSKSNKKDTPLFPPDEPAIPPALDTPEFRELWGKWIGHRAAKQSKLTPHAAELQLKKLAEWGVTRAVAALTFSISNGYTGIFEDKHGGQQTGRVGADSRVRAAEGKYRNIGITVGETQTPPPAAGGPPAGSAPPAQRDRALFENDAP